MFDAGSRRPRRGTPCSWRRTASRRRADSSSLSRDWVQGLFVACALRRRATSGFVRPPSAPSSAAYGVRVGQHPGPSSEEHTLRAVPRRAWRRHADGDSFDHERVSYIPRDESSRRQSRRSRRSASGAWPRAPEAASASPSDASRMRLGRALLARGLVRGRVRSKPATLRAFAFSCIRGFELFPGSAFNVFDFRRACRRAWETSLDAFYII